MVEAAGVELLSKITTKDLGRLVLSERRQNRSKPDVQYKTGTAHQH
jgi:hypothetical protein